MVARQRFAREARVCASVQHPNVISILDFGTLPSSELFYTMEYLPYKTLRDLLQEGETFTQEQIIHMMKQLASALNGCHENGVIHRDVTASNILLKENDELILADFGLVYEEDKTRMTMTGGFVGTPLYLPPEALLSREVDARSDVYQFGLLFYELLARKALLKGDRVISDLFSQIMAPEFDPPAFMDLPPNNPWRPLLTRCLARDVELRPSSMKELLQSLNTSEGPTAESKNETLLKPPKQHSPSKIIPLVCVILLATLLYLVVFKKSTKNWSVEDFNLERKARSVSVSWRSQSPYPTVINVKGASFHHTYPASTMTTCTHFVDVDGLTPNTQFSVSVIFPNGERSLAKTFKTLKKTPKEWLQVFRESLSEYLTNPSINSSSRLMTKARECETKDVLQLLSNTIVDVCYRDISKHKVPFMPRVEKASAHYFNLLEVALKTLERNSDIEFDLRHCAPFLSASFSFFRAFSDAEDNYKRLARGEKMDATTVFSFGGRPRYFKFMTKVEKRLAKWKSVHQKVPISFEVLHAIALDDAHYIQQAAEYAKDIRRRLLSKGLSGEHIDAILLHSITLEAEAYHKMGKVNKVFELLEVCRKLTSVLQEGWEKNPYIEDRGKFSHAIHQMSKTLAEAKNVPKEKLLSFYADLTDIFQGTFTLTDLKGKVRTHKDYSADLKQEILEVMSR